MILNHENFEFFNFLIFSLFSKNDARTEQVRGRNRVQRQEKFWITQQLVRKISSSGRKSVVEERVGPSFEPGRLRKAHGNLLRMAPFGSTPKGAIRPAPHPRTKILPDISPGPYPGVPQRSAPPPAGNTHEIPAPPKNPLRRPCGKTHGLRSKKGNTPPDFHFFRNEAISCAGVACKQFLQKRLNCV